MDGDQRTRRQRGRRYPSAKIFEPHRSPERGASRSDTHTNDRLRLDRRNFRGEPRIAGVDLTFTRLLMQSAFAARDPFEMFDGVRDVHPFAIDAGVYEGAFEQLAGRSYEWMAGVIFLIARLFAD